MRFDSVEFKAAIFALLMAASDNFDWQIVSKSDTHFIRDFIAAFVIGVLVFSFIAWVSKLRGKVVQSAVKDSAADVQGGGKP